MKKELLSKKEPEHEDLEEFLPIHIAKKKRERETACSEENTKVMA